MLRPRSPPHPRWGGAVFAPPYKRAADARALPGAAAVVFAPPHMHAAPPPVQAGSAQAQGGAGAGAGCVDGALCDPLVPAAIPHPHWDKFLAASVLPRRAPYADGLHRVQDPDPLL